MRFEFNSPGVSKVVIVGFLIFLESLIGGFLVITQGGDMPTSVQALTILLVAAMALITHFLTFLKTEKKGGDS